MKIFQKILGIVLLVATTNNFVWFGLTYWAYLSTKSVVSTGLVGGMFLVANVLSSFWFGSIVDHHKKKSAMLGSSITTLILFAIGYFAYQVAPADAFAVVESWYLWVFVLVLLLGVIAGSIYQIAVPTLVTLLVEKDVRDKANGMVGMIWGISFAITSVASGFTLAYGGMRMILLIALVMTAVAIAALAIMPITEKKLLHIQEEGHKKVDLAGTIKVVKKIPGLFALIFYTTFNNFIGGVFMALMDAYGLTMVSVQVWGTLWAFLSFGFIFGGMYISKKGLGDNPVHSLFTINTVIWLTCLIFPIQPSIVLVALGSLVWMTMFPFIEATEQTIIQKVVPQERQGRVFGFAHSVEQAASPLTAFMIGPIAQYAFIPFMTTGKGVELIGSWFGTGPGRGIALVFMMAGLIGLTVTQFARRSKSYQLLAARYKE